MAAIHLPRRPLVALAIVAAVAAAVMMSLYGRQIVSTVTHVEGAARTTEPYTPVEDDPGAVFRIAVAGDVGTGGSRLDRTVEAMLQAAGDDPYDALLLLGDNVYPEGEVALLDERVLEPFDPVLAQGSDLFAILGNHDVMSGEGDEMMTALGMPGRYWQRRFGELLLVGLDSTRPDDRQQLDWLERTLDDTTARWVIVALHHPPYSSGYQGSNEDTRRIFSPIFERFGVELVLSGHDHDYQRTWPINGVSYVVSGAAATTRRTATESFTATAVSWHHFVEIALLDDRLVVRAVNQDMDVFDELTLW